VSKLQVNVDEQLAADIVAILRRMRELPAAQEDPEFDSRLRAAEFAFTGALRSVGWEPKPGGGWQMRSSVGRRRR
jgi:hypothetical protein